MQSTSGGFIGHWTRHTWDWTPPDERWSPEKGEPKGCVYIAVSTEHQPPEEAFEFWRNQVFYLFEVDEARSNNKNGFYGSLEGLVSGRGHFYTYSFDRIVANRTKELIDEDNSTDIDIGFVIEGTIHEKPEQDIGLTTRSGEPFFSDLAVPSEVTWDVRRAFHMRLRREPVENALGGNIPTVSAMTRAIASSPMWPFIRSHMTLLADNISTLSDFERTALLDHMIDITLSTLRGIGMTLHVDTSINFGGLFDAARRYIINHLHHPDLSPDDIALAVNCSRTTLYRAFSDHGLTVSGFVREQRLQTFARYLQTAPSFVPIAILAERSGFNNIVTARKNFQQRFGKNPTDLRQER